MLARLTSLRWVMVSLVFLFAATANAQKTVSGIITNATNQPIIGASVVVKGTNTGTTTDAQGRYTIPVPNDQSVLVISFVGFGTQEVAVAGKNNINVNLNENGATMNEVVVTGYSSQAKKDITGSVSVVNVKELTANPGSNVQNLLQGKAAGVTVGTSGIPGAGSNIRIHGFSTFTTNEPLYIVDGARVNSITELNPNDIETMQILKDASAASIYGSAAAGGVIIITTKRGKSGKPKITYDTYYGRQTFNKRLDLMNTKEYGDYLYLLALNSNNIKNDTFRHGQYAGPNGWSTKGPIIPDYIYANGSYAGAPGKNGGIPAGDPSVDPSLYRLDLFDVNGPGTYLIVPANKQGTDWIGAILQEAPMMNHQITASGGGDNANYLFGLDYFDQKGIVYTTRYQRYALRANTSFN
ncbi:MAG: TonB-dependent receptor plug domain-containing protein, partial [Bacteroidota bacterium]|nr:TonB-dependent receptor plug domain-containing protein [Bacteroidota bacterium]